MIDRALYAGDLDRRRMWWTMLVTDRLSQLAAAALNRSGFVGGSNFQIGWSRYEQDDEQIFF